MLTENSLDVTKLLLSWSNGQEEAGERLMHVVYDDLRRIAGHFLRNERSDHTLQPTALVNEVYLRLIDQKEIDWKSRTHFFGLAARMMRRILVDHARRRKFAKRGGGLLRVPIEDIEQLMGDQSTDLLALDDALTELAKLDPRKAEIVELRYFGGLAVQEIASLKECSIPTINRQWRAARAWLFSHLNPSLENGVPEAAPA